MASSPTEDAAVPSLRTIESALKLVEQKKNFLKEAFLNLEAHPSSSAFLTFSWSELDAHFSFISSTLSRRFSILLQSYDSAPEPSENSDGKDSVNTSELGLLCQKMDGKAIREYISARIKDMKVTRTELEDSLRHARDPATLVLDAVEQFGTLSNKEKQICLFILVEFVKNKPVSINQEIKQRAKNLGIKWFHHTNFNRGSSPQVLALMNLIAGFDLGKEMDANVLISCFSAACCCNAAPNLLKMADVDTAVIASLIEKLLDEKKHVYAVRYVCELGLTEKFHPEDILKTYLIIQKDEVSEEGKDAVMQRNSKRSKEITSLQLAMKIIEDYKFSCPKAELLERIEMLKMRKEDEMPSPSAAAGKEFQKRKKAQEHKHKKRRIVSSGVAAAPPSFAGRPVVRMPAPRPRMPPHGIRPIPPFHHFEGNPYISNAPSYPPLQRFRPPFLENNSFNSHNFSDYW